MSAPRTPHGTPPVARRTRRRDHADQLAYVGVDGVDRVLELRALGDRTRAVLVEQCAQNAQPCNLRACPGCSVRLLQEIGETADAILRQMRTATWVRIVVPARQEGDLPNLWARSRSELCRLIRPGHMRALRWVLGSIRIEDADRAPHGAVVIDLAVDIDDLDIPRLERNSRRLGGVDARFCVVAEHVRRPRDLLPEFVVGTHWFPRPRSVPLQRLSQLWPAQHRRRLLFVWSGAGRNRRTTGRRAR